MHAHMGICTWAEWVKCSHSQPMPYHIVQSTSFDRVLAAHRVRAYC